jgi:hypothetical protein
LKGLPAFEAAQLQDGAHAREGLEELADARVGVERVRTAVFALPDLEACDPQAAFPKPGLDLFGRRQFSNKHDS